MNKIEKFFIINKDSDLYINYYKYLENRKITAKIAGEFLKKVGIETTSVYVSKHLGIVPTENDLKKIGKMLAIKEYGDGLRLFKNNSKILKDWNNYLKCNKISILSKPDLWSIFIVTGKVSSRLFRINDILYGSFAAEYDFEIPEQVKEIKASEFYKAIEDENK